MNRLIYSFLAYLFFFNGNLGAQVTIGSGEAPAKGALLQLKNLPNKIDQLVNANGGLGMPRVYLSKIKPENGAEFAASIGGTGEWNMKEHIGLLVYHVSSEENPTEYSSGLYV